MEYENSVAILKQVAEGYSPLNKSVGGIARIESEGGVNRLFLSVINALLIEDGEYFVFLLDLEGKVFSHLLSIKPTSFNFVLEEGNFDEGFCLGLVFIKNSIPEVVAFSRTEGFSYTLSDFKKAVAGECLKRKTLEEKALKKVECDDNSEIVCSKAPILSPKNEDGGGYDDEAVATENYFDFTEDDILSFAEVEIESISNENGDAVNCREKETQEIEENAFCKQFKKSAVKGEKYSRDNPYYLREKEELDLIFSKFPEESSLKKLFPLSRWAKINYAEEKFYVVGEIIEEGEPKYICYGVPGSYSATPPKEFEGFCSFIPLSVFEMMGDGFWIMFQDAITGECVLTPRN